MKRYVVGICGRSGSGKTTLVKDLVDHFGPEFITLHTMDNYYLPREEQVIDEEKYLNFDLPCSFYREQFCDDLHSLIRNETVDLKEYNFNNKSEGTVLKIHSAPIILVEGLFVFHYEEIRKLMNVKVLVEVCMQEAFRRRLLRDQRERNYKEEEITYRYMNHVEPAYQKYIAPYEDQMHVRVNNEDDMKQDKSGLIRSLEGLL